jgi:hypothetical protein
MRFLLTSGVAAPSGDARSPAGEVSPAARRAAATGRLGSCPRPSADLP